MSAVYEQYTEELREKYGYLATWLPNIKLKLGDIGVLKRDRFEFITTLDDLGISFKTRDISEAADYEYISADGANVEFNAGADVAGIGTTIGKSSAKASVFFKRANAVVFVAKGCKTTLIEQHDRLGKQIVALYQAGKWPKEHVIITELVTAESATILISATADAKIDFSATSQIAPLSLSLAEATAGLQIARSSGIATQILASRQLTPLFRASGVRRSLLSGSRFDTRSANAADKQPSSTESAVFSDLDYADLE